MGWTGQGPGSAELSEELPHVLDEECPLLWVSRGLLDHHIVGELFDLTNRQTRLSTAPSAVAGRPRLSHPSAGSVRLLARRSSSPLRVPTVWKPRSGSGHPWSKTPSTPMPAIWMAPGNNPAIQDELGLRIRAPEAGSWVRPAPAHHSHACGSERVQGRQKGATATTARGPDSCPVSVAAILRSH